MSLLGSYFQADMDEKEFPEFEDFINPYLKTCLHNLKYSRGICKCRIEEATDEEVIDIARGLLKYCHDKQSNVVFYYKYDAPHYEDRIYLIISRCGCKNIDIDLMVRQLCQKLIISRCDGKNIDIDLMVRQLWQKQKEAL